MPYRKFARLQDEYLAVSKQMREAEGPEQKLLLLEKLQAILKESQAVLVEMHEEQSKKKSSA
jgi:hypothetical protein